MVEIEIRLVCCFVQLLGLCKLLQKMKEKKEKKINYWKVFYRLLDWEAYNVITTLPTPHLVLNLGITATKIFCKSLRCGPNNT